MIDETSFDRPWPHGKPRILYRLSLLFLRQSRLIPSAADWSRARAVPEVEGSGLQRPQPIGAGLRQARFAPRKAQNVAALQTFCTVGSAVQTPAGRV